MTEYEFLEAENHCLTLMKKKIDLLTYSNKWLDKFLIWLNIKSESAYVTNDQKAAKL